jgi:hypothetical protein
VGHSRPAEEVVVKEWLRWTGGRLGTGYRKLLVARWMRRNQRGLLGFDVWLLDYPPGAHVPSHLDTVPLARHFRLNVVLRTGDTRYEGRTLCASASACCSSGPIG